LEASVAVRERDELEVAGERRGEERGKGGRGKESDEAPGERD